MPRVLHSQSLKTTGIRYGGKLITFPGSRAASTPRTQDATAKQISQELLKMLLAVQQDAKRLQLQIEKELYDLSWSVINGASIQSGEFMFDPVRRIITRRAESR